MSGYVQDNPGHLLKLSLGAGYCRLRAAEMSTSGLGGSGEILRDDTSGSFAPCDGEVGGGDSLSIISRGRSPEDEFCEEGLRAGLQRICFGHYSQRQNRICLSKYSFTYGSVEDQPPCEVFFPRLEAFVSKSLEAPLFLPGRGDFRFHSPIILLCGGTYSSNLDV